MNTKNNITRFFSLMLLFLLVTSLKANTAEVPLGTAFPTQIIRKINQQLQAYFYPEHNKAASSMMTCTGNADAIHVDIGVSSQDNALGTPDNSVAIINDQGDQLALDLTDIVKAGETYTIRWRRNTGTSNNPSFTVEESRDGATWVAATGSPFTEASTTFSNNDFIASIDTRYVRIITTNVFDLDVDAISYNNVNCCTVSPNYETLVKTRGTCNGANPNNDASFTLGGITNGDRADVSTADAASYDGDNYANAQNITGGEITFSSLQHDVNYIVRLYGGVDGCPIDININSITPPDACASFPADLPWAGSTCNTETITLQNGVAPLTCGVTITIAPPDRYAFAFMNIDGLVPASGRVENTNLATAYHHDSWHIDEIGNVYGTSIRPADGSVYITASSNFAAAFSFNDIEAIIRYGALAGGTVSGNDDFEAGGAIYRIDPITGEATLFTRLPQQAATFTHESCESATTKTRTNSGVGLGNIIYDEIRDQFFVSNMEDGRIYRINAQGTILDTYDPFGDDDSVAGVSNIEELVYGLALEAGGNRLFFGGVDFAPGNNAQPGSPGVYSIDLSTTGGFTGTNTATGLGYDNYTGTETLHTTILVGDVDDTAPGFVPDDYVYLISDLAFNASGDLIAGIRVGCNNSLFTSYNHYGKTSILTLNTGNNLYDAVTDLDISFLGDAGPEDGYGGVATYVDNNGDDIIVVSSADILAEIGPHGLAIFNDPPNTGGAVTPLAAISYGIDLNGDPKGVGGDMEIFEACLPCDVALTTNDEAICEGNTISLDTLLTNVNNSTPVDTAYFATLQQAIDSTSAISTTVSPANSTTYYVRLTGPTYGFCYQVDSILITVNPNPTLTVDDRQCNFNALQFTYTVELTSDADQVTISPNNGTVNNNNDGTFTINDIPDGENITITATNTTINCFTTADVTAPNCPCPAVNAPSSNGDQSACENATPYPALTVTVGIGETADWYATATGGTPLASGTTSYVPPSPGTYYAETRNITNGCTSNVRTAVTLTVTNIQITSTTQTCQDNGTGGDGNDDYFTIEITATNVNPGGSNQYNVYHGAELLASGITYSNPVNIEWADAAMNQRFAADNSTTYTLRVEDIDNSGCSTDFMTVVQPSCSTCPPQTCLPINVNIKKLDGTN